MLAAQGAVELTEVELDASTTTVFNGTVKASLIDAADVATTGSKQQDISQTSQH